MSKSRNQKFNGKANLNSTEIKNGLQELIKSLRQEQLNFSGTKVRIAILGRSGTGKSTFMNTMAGERLSPTNPIGEETGVDNAGNKINNYEPKCYQVAGLEFYDLPGFGTSNFPSATFLNDFRIKENYDCVIFMSSLRFNTEADITVYNQIKNSGIPCFVVWTKFDETIRRAHKDDPSLPKEPSELAKVIYARIKSDLRDNSVNCFVISDEPLKHDFTKLKKSIEDNLQGIKKQRFIQSAFARTQSDLKNKRVVAEKMITWASVLSAANALNPIPGLDIGVDISVLLGLSQEISKMYGITKEQLEFLPEALQADMKKKILMRMSEYVTQEGIFYFLEKIASRVAVKTFAKWLPIIGTAIAAGIGYKITLSFGENLLDDCEAFAYSVLDEEITSLAS